MRKKIHNIKKKRSFIISVCVLAIICVGIVAVNVMLYLNKPLESQEIRVSFEVSDGLGINTGTDSLDYGILIPGFSADKKITLENTNSFPVTIEVLLTPNLEGYIYGKKEVVISPHEEITYTVSLKVPEDAQKGNYSGMLLFETYKQK